MKLNIIQSLNWRKYLYKIFKKYIFHCLMFCSKVTRVAKKVLIDEANFFLKKRNSGKNWNYYPVEGGHPHSPTSCFAWEEKKSEYKIGVVHFNFNTSNKMDRPGFLWASKIRHIFVWIITSKTVRKEDDHACTCEHCQRRISQKNIKKVKYFFLFF